MLGRGRCPIPVGEDANVEWPTDACILNLIRTIVKIIVLVNYLLSLVYLQITHH